MLLEIASIIFSSSLVRREQLRPRKIRPMAEHTPQKLDDHLAYVSSIRLASLHLGQDQTLTVEEALDLRISVFCQAEIFEGSLPSTNITRGSVPQ